jgi:peptidyl-prolyl cis-trans isomerase A (cyclophilin A)
MAVVRHTIGLALLSLVLVACDSHDAASSGGPHPGLHDPALARETAPERFKVRFETTKGDFVVEAVRAWAPHGVDRFYNLVKIGYFDGNAFFRVVKDFMAQFGIHGDPEVAALWQTRFIEDDPMGAQRNLPGYVAFGQMGRPNTRSTQLFINTRYGGNPQLDRSFPPIGRIVDDAGLTVVYRLYNGYGENPRTLQPNLVSRGNDWLKEQYPQLDYIERATLVD